MGKKIQNFSQTQKPALTPRKTERNYVNKLSKNKNNGGNEKKNK